MHGHPGPAAGHYTPFPGHAPPGQGHAGFSRGRALPVIVACGLAMGVFVGLVVVRGTGEAEGSVTATVTQPTSDGDQGDKKPEARPAAGQDPAPAPADGKPPDVKPEDGKPTDVKPEDGKPADTKAADAKQPLPEPAPAADTAAILTFNLSPADAVVTVDGNKIADGRSEVKLVEGKARVRLIAKAGGYKSYDKSHLVTGDEAISIELVKKPRRSSSGKSPSGPGGLIDLR